MNLYIASPAPAPVFFSPPRPCEIYIHTTEEVAREHAERLKAMTGDYFTVVKYGGRYRVIRVDPGGKKVE
jgi:hypothetical protein